jgi:hypothetical protein
MGIFSVLGSFLGPVGGAVGALADGVVGHNQKKKQVGAQNALEMDKYVRLRDAAERGGFHPLEVLRSGGEVATQASPRLLTSLSSANAFDALEGEFSGKAAAERNRQNVRDELERLEAERLKYDVVQRVFTRPTIGGLAVPPGGTLGSDKAESIPAPVSSLDTKPDGFVTDPHTPDADQIIGRFGESEIAQELMFLPNAIHDWAHDRIITELAERKGVGKAEMNQWVFDNFDSTAEFRAWALAQEEKESAEQDGQGLSPFSREFWGGTVNTEPPNTKTRRNRIPPWEASGWSP